MSVLSLLKNNGFSKVSSVFSGDEISKLSHACLEILNCSDHVEYPELPKVTLINSFVECYHNDKSRTNFINQKFRNCIGVSEEIDRLLVKFFNNSNINEVLSHFFVKPKLNFCTIRYADDNSNWLGIHSDSGATLTMSILLNDTDDSDATTSFIPGSHLYKNPVRNKIERLNPSFFSNLLEYSTGSAGDVNIFLNRTAHGVMKQTVKSKNQSNAIILLCFHCDQNLQHRNMVLPEVTLYGKNMISLDNNILNLFDFDHNERKERNINNISEEYIENQRFLQSDSIMDKNILNYRNLSLKESLICFYLKCFEYFIKSIRICKSIIK
jgi:putative 2OG-Fe(II) oxygenase